MSNRKTNAMRFLDNLGVNYKMLSYDKKDGNIDGVSVAEKINRPVTTVFKTLVTQSDERQTYVFVIPVAEELDLKAAARVVGEKRIDMIQIKDLVKLTGYVRGGCSPIGMKRLYPTFIDRSAEEIPNIIVSGGRIGSQIELCPFDLQKVINAQFSPLTK